MKTSTASILAFLCLAGTRAWADTYTWTNRVAGAFNWNVPASWKTNTFPNTAGDVVNLTANLTGAETVSLNQASITIGTLNIGDSDNTHPYRIATNAAGQLLILDNGAAAAQINQRSTSKGDTIAAPLQINGSLNLTNAVNTTGVNLVLADALSSGATSGIQTLTAVTPAAGGITIRGAISDGSSGGAIALNKSGFGTGVLILTNANTFSGGLTVSGGTLTGYGQNSGGPFGSGSLTIGGATSSNANGSVALALVGLAAPTTAASGDLIVNGAFNSGSLTVNATAGAGPTLLQCANLTRNGLATLAVTPTQNSLGGKEQITFTGGNGLVNGILAPWLVSTANNGEFLTYGATGLTNAAYVANINTATATDVAGVSAATNLMAPRAVYALKAGANINLNGNCLTVGDGATAGLILNNASITNSGAAANLDFGTAEGLVFVNTAITGTIGVPIAGTGGLTKLGAGTLVFANNALYGGDIALQAGTLTLNPASDLAYSNRFTGAGTLGKSGNAAATLTGATNLVGGVTVSGGTLAVDGTTFINLGASLGGSTNGTLLVSNGGQLVTPAAGSSVAVACRVTLSDTNEAGLASTWNVAGGTPSVQNTSVLVDGGIVTNQFAALIGSVPGGAATVTASAAITNGGGWFTGNGGAVVGNAQLSALIATGCTMTVAGANPASGRKATWNLGGGTLYISAENNAGNGATAISNAVKVYAGGIITNAGQISLGASQGGYWGELNVADGGQVFCGSLVSGNQGGFHRVIVRGPGSLLNNGGGAITIGLGGGSGAGNSNQVIVSGADAVITNVGAITVADRVGGGTLMQGNALIVTNGGRLYSSGTVLIGSGYTASTTNNCAWVTGAQSLWNLGGGALTVGYGNQGFSLANWLCIDQGGVVTNAGAVNVGQLWARNGDRNRLIITNGGSLFSTGAATIGHAWQQANYGTYSNSAQIAGGLAGDALWNVRGSLTIGYSQSGRRSDFNSMAVSSGGAVTNINTLMIGNSAYASNNLAMLSGGSLSATNLAMNAGTNNTFIFNSGLLQLQMAAVTNGLPFVVGDGGARSAELNLTGGTNKTLSFFNGLVITNNGILSGSGRIASPTTIWGTLAPGGTNSAATILFTSNLTLTASAVVALDVGSAQSDVIVATGQTVDLAGATLAVTPAPGYVPPKGRAFTNLVAGVLTGGFGNVAGDRVTATDGSSFAVNTGDNRVVLSNYSPRPTGTVIQLR